LVWRKNSSVSIFPTSGKRLKGKSVFSCSFFIKCLTFEFFLPAFWFFVLGGYAPLPDPRKYPSSETSPFPAADPVEGVLEFRRFTFLVFHRSFGLLLFFHIDICVFSLKPPGADIVVGISPGVKPDCLPDRRSFRRAYALRMQESNLLPPAYETGDLTTLSYPPNSPVTRAGCAKVDSRPHSCPFLL
jgi:hypothetical protein